MKTRKHETNMKLHVIGISLIFFLCGFGSFLNPAIQACIEAWPDVPVANIRMASTIPSLISLPIMLFASKYVSKIGYRFCMLFGAILVTIGGIVPFFYTPSWNFVLVCRVIAGVGTGFLGLRNALLLNSFEKEEHSKYVGVSNAMNAISNISASIFGGILVGYGWKAPFATQFLGLLVIFFVAIGVHEPEGKNEEPHKQPGVQTASASQRSKLDYRIWAYAVIIFVQSVVIYPVLSGMTTFVITRGIASAAVAGVLLAAHNIGGFFAGFLIDMAEKKLGHFVVAFSYFLIFLGQVMDLMIPNAACIFIGTALTGVGYFLAYSSMTVYVGRFSRPDTVALGSTILLIAMSLGIFLSVYYMTASHAIVRASDDVVSSWTAGSVILGIAAAALIPFSKKLFPLQSKESGDKS